jgi:hypothetical protein
VLVTVVFSCLLALAQNERPEKRAKTARSGWPTRENGSFPKALPWLDNAGKFVVSPMISGLEHDPEKGVPVFPDKRFRLSKDHAQ